jgi:hypothetical protein
MEPSQVNWKKYLTDGVCLMEGATDTGMRNYEGAKHIFGGCVTQTEDLNVKAEGYFRFAQLRYYQGYTDYIATYLHVGEEALLAVTSAATRVQCWFLRAIVEEQSMDHHAVFRRYQELWDMEFDDHKLRADIANRLARVTPDLTEQCQWITHTLNHLSQISTPDLLDLHALASAQSRAAVLFLQRARTLFTETEKTFSNGHVHDRMIRSRHWKNRATCALVAWQPLRVLWFAFRTLAAQVH